jgi:metal-responsive CopG/Arc/MetJ family transcriptional regulator
MSTPTIRTTLSIPTDLLQATDNMVKHGKTPSRNQFIAQALKHELTALKRAEIDATLIEMTQQADYQAEVLQMNDEFGLAR